MIKYRHRNCDRAFIPATFAYILPPANAFQEMVYQAQDIINFPFGLTLLHKKDCYVKAEGRKYAERDMRIRVLTSFKLNRITIYNKRVHFLLDTDDTTLPLWIQISVDFEGSKVRLEHIDFK